MSRTIKYIADKKIVEVIVRGRINFGTAQNYSVEAIKVARENNCSRFLIDHSKTELFEGIQRIYTDGAVLEQFGFQVTDKIAIVIESKNNHALLTDAAANNIKWSNFRYFNTVTKAVEWLLKK